MLPVHLLALLALVVGCYVTPVHAAVMTFNSLPDDFSEILTHTEDDITFSADPNHFHSESLFFNGTVVATLFSSDGTPAFITFDNGALFNLISLILCDFDVTSPGPVTFTSSSGTVQNIDIDTPLGLVEFGPGFRNVSFVRMDIPDPDNDTFISIDDITVSPVPEPSTLALVGLGLIIGGARIRRQISKSRSVSC